MDLLHVLAFLCMVGSCSAGECLAADEASSESLGLAFIQTYAKSSRAASPPLETKEHSSPPLDDTGHKTWRQGSHGREGEKLQDMEKSQLQDVEKRKQKPETKEDERSDEKDKKEKDVEKRKQKPETKEDERSDEKDKKEKEETKAGEETEKKDEKTEENAEKTTEEKVEKPESQSEAKSEGKAEETEKEEPALKAEGKAEADSPDSTAEGPDSAVEGPLGEKAEEKIEESAEAKSEEESAGATSEGTSENAAEGAAGAKREESYPAKAEHHGFEELHGWIDRHVAHGYGHDLALDSLDRIKNKAEYFEAAREKYGEYQDHKQSGIVLGFIVGTPVWFTLFSLYVMCCSKRDRDADYSNFKGGMTDKLSDHTQRDDHLGLIGRIMEAGWFRLCILSAVLVDLFCLFIIGTVNQTDWLNPKYKVQGANYAHGLRDVNIVILCVFLAEQFLHSITHGKLFFRHMWYMLDLVGSYLALVTGCLLLDLYPDNKFIPYLELLPLMRLWNVVAIILDLLLVTALAVEHEDEEIMQEEAVAEEIAKEIAEGKEDGEVEALTEKVEALTEKL